VIAVTRECVADRLAVFLGEQRDTLVDHPLDLRALEVRRVLGIRQRRQLELEPLDERHEQIDVLRCGVADRQESTPA